VKKKSTSLSAVFDLCVLIALVVFLADVFLALFGFGAFSNAFAQAKVSARGSSELSSDGVTSETIELQQVALTPRSPSPMPVTALVDSSSRSRLERSGSGARHSFPP
jgi:hypothetical protein